MHVCTAAGAGICRPLRFNLWLYRAVPTAEHVLPSRCGRLAPLEHRLQLRLGQQAAATAAHALRRAG